ncbi:hypothetical protein EDP1_275 [Pseudomonas putida S610]|nr:hypothetical protein EDP1_275 [Pseudomonas putida S610]
MVWIKSAARFKNIIEFKRIGLHFSWAVCRQAAIRMSPSSLLKDRKRNHESTQLV